ncbi:protein KRI1 homolog [Arctopsyche grandis]|uniref:protein KRI1 homolog n=1 Tax=Arctopsyche grandis TaxID=121162 RepID=UPI00406D6337
MSRVLFDEDDSENEVTFKKSSEYSKKYETLRRKEELLKLKNKYGEQVRDEDESSSSEDIDDVTFSEQFERDFYKTLSCLKNKDPRIYDNATKFFDENSQPIKQKQNTKEKALTVRDYNREMVLNEEISEDEDDYDKRPPSPSYVEEQNEIKKAFHSAIDANENDLEKKSIGGLFVKKRKTKEEEEEEEKNYRDWLCGQANHLKDNNEENDLKPLKDYWSNPKLDVDEAFLRDYVLNQRFKENNDSDRIPSYDEIVNENEDVSEDERLFGQQTEFEHKFNFRFEEPDQDFIKRYPRTLEHTLRRKDDKRSKKRSEIKERKAEEKKRKKEEISQLKALKLKEIQDKILQLKEITGNDQLAFDPEDLENDFDPDAHDRKMKELFDEEYYQEEVDVKKPKFPELDEEIDIENWDSWGANKDENDFEPHCEDENFNMDCEYDPTAESSKSLLENLKETVEGPKRKRQKKNKLSQALSKSKPVFDPNKLNQTFSQYIEEYYKLDCEDVIGDMPCRFKYRQVPACDYGLTVEEILMADDKELNRWYPLKKTLQYRPDHMQHNDQKVYSRKANDMKLKMKYLQSVYKPNNTDDDINQEDNDNTVSKSKKKKRKKKNKEPSVVNDNANVESSEPAASKKRKLDHVDKDKDDQHKETVESANSAVEDTTAPAKKKRKRNKKKNVDTNGSFQISDNIPKSSNNTDNPSTKNQKSDDHKNKSKKNKNKNNFDNNQNGKSKDKNKLGLSKNSHKIHKKNKESSNKNDDNLASKLSDERLKAYGLNPKKYRSFMKFKKY